MTSNDFDDLSTALSFTVFAKSSVCCLFCKNSLYCGFYELCSLQGALAVSSHHNTAAAQILQLKLINHNESSWALQRKLLTESPLFCQDRNALILPWDGCLRDCVSPFDWQEIRSAWRQHSDLCNCTSERRGHGTKVCLIALREEIWRAGLWLMVASDWCSLHAALQWALSRPLPVCNRIKSRHEPNGWKPKLSIWFLLRGDMMIFTLWFSREFYNEIYSLEMETGSI